MMNHFGTELAVLNTNQWKLACRFKEIEMTQPQTLIFIEHVKDDTFNQKGDSREAVVYNDTGEENDNL